MPRISPESANGEGCLAIALLVAIAIVIMVVIGLNAEPENEAAGTIPSNQLAN
jgi:hypothetical protein